jgi:hypothetical protein
MLRGSRLSRTSLCRGWLPIARKFVEDAARANVRAFRDALAAVGA